MKLFYIKCHKELSSSVWLKGISRKTIIFIVLIVAVMLDRLLNTGNWVFRTVACYFYIANSYFKIKNLKNLV
ncbi:phage holin family protein [Clostridium perfringens]|nr:phage holin family protein [Clostridium perfringens]